MLKNGQFYKLLVLKFSGQDFSYNEMASFVLIQRFVLIQLLAQALVWFHMTAEHVRQTVKITVHQPRFTRVLYREVLKESRAEHLHKTLTLLSFLKS